MLALLLSLAPLQSAQADPQLPPPPKDWRTERLQLPPDFAPELEMHGVEDLAFAPGMFAPESDSYFSYALALRFDGEPDVDEAYLQRFLEGYYRGLCRAVGESSHFKLDLAAITALVRREGEGFRATVDLFDPFVTGEALELEIELLVHSAPRRTEILGLASPFDRGADVWKELHALADGWRAKRPAPLFLNHVYVVPDRETFDALASSDFLRTFAVCEQRKTVRADLSYTGLYLYGTRTYLEFLPPGAAGLVEGASGVAFGLERPGASEDFARALEKQQLKTQLAPITREFQGKQVPWFRLLGLEMPSAALSLFTLEYEPRFLASWHAELPPEGGGIARAAVLARYTAALGLPAAREPAPFADVTEVRLTLDDPQTQRLLALCAAAQYEIGPGGEHRTLLGPQFRILLEKSAKPGGVTGLELALKKPLEHEPLRLGKAVLSFHGSVAELEFPR